MPMNHSRDQLIEEISCEDPEEYIREKFRGKEFTYDKTVMKDGSNCL